MSICDRAADSDEVARAFRDDVARYSDMMSPGVSGELKNFLQSSTNCRQRCCCR